VRALRDFDPAEDLADVAAALRAVKNELDGALPLLGFAGAPFTVAAFMIEGRSPGGRLDATRALMRDEPAILHDLLERLSRMTAAYLRMQIDAGADAVQLFESLGDLLTDEEYRTFAHPYQAQALADLPGSAPRILFVKERPCVELMAATGADAISVGSCVDLADARRRLGPGVGLQGNVDNQLLARGSREAIEAAVRRCAREGGQRGHILNLSHGLLADTPEDNVRRLIDACHAFRLDDADGPGSPREGTPS
jgi:uroporphyrinogen decarboxylase